MNRQLLACLALAAALLPSSLGAQERRATISPWLRPLAERPTPDIPPILRSPLGGGQGRYRLGDREALHLHVRTTATREELERLGVHVRTLINGFATVTLLPEDLPALAAAPGVLAIALPQPLEPVLEQSLPDTGIPPLRTLSNGTFTGATGAGVIVGVFDSGIDLDHPNFKRPDGKTRILYLWDQATDEECDEDKINNGDCLQQDSLDAAGHGTHVTGIAAGNGAAPDGGGASWTHVGVAPESSIIFVKMDPDTFSLGEALNYIFHKAYHLDMPAVINLSINSDLGPHDGSHYVEYAIDDLVTHKPGRAVVVAAGNSRGRDIHAEVKATTAEVRVTGPTFQIPKYKPKPEIGDDIVLITGYYAETDDITVHLVSPSGIRYKQDLDFEDCSPEMPGADGTVQICNTVYSSLPNTTDAREILIGIYDGPSGVPPKSGDWTILVTGNTVAGKGEVDFWMASDLGAEGARASFITMIDPYETVGTPGSSREAITVGAHVTRLCWEDFKGGPQVIPYVENYTLGDSAPYSSLGPTRDGRPKPELSAPGTALVAPMAAGVKDVLLAEDLGWTVVNDSYRLAQGTSMSAPHVTGAVALLLQKNPTATNATLRSLLVSSARDDAFTRQYDSLYVNPVFGSGKLDLGRWGFKDPYETNDLASQAWTALSGQLFEGYIERAADVDYFHLQGVQGGDTVEVTLDSLPQDYALELQARTTTPDPCSWGSLSLEASSNQTGTAGESITYIEPSGIQSTFDGPADYLRVTSSAGATSSSDTYLLKAVLTRPETVSPHNSEATAQKLPPFVEMKVTGMVSGIGGDYYAFDVRQGQTITLNVPGRALTFYKPDGTSTNAFESLTYDVPSGGYISSTDTYYVEVKGGLNGEYTLTLKVE